MPSRFVAAATTLVLTSTIAASATGCIAFRAATNDVLRQGATSDPEQVRRRRHARTNRGIIATTVGAAEIGVGVLAIIGMAVGAGFRTADDDDASEGSSGAIGDAAEGAAEGILASGMLGAIGSLLVISGLGDVGCGTADLFHTDASCDGTIAVMYPEDGTPPPPVDEDDVPAASGDHRPKVGAIGAIKGVTPRPHHGR
jgi:hypothetical protein